MKLQGTNTYFFDKETYIERIKQKEIHEDIATSPINNFNEGKTLKIGSFPDFISTVRASSLIKKMRSKLRNHHAVQVPCLGFDSQNIKQRQGYYLKTEQMKILYQSLQENNIDILVISLAEFDNKLPSDLALAAITERKEASFALLSLSETVMSGKDQVAVSSLALGQQLRTENADFWCIEQSFNFDEGVDFLLKEKFKGVVLPLSDIKLASQEMKLDKFTFSILNPERLVPPAGQGSLALIVRKKDAALFQEIYNIFHHHQSAYIFEWENRAAKLLNFTGEKAGSYMMLRGQDYYLNLYNPQLIRPFHRLAANKIGNRKNGVDIRLFNALLHEVYGELAVMGLGLGTQRGLTVEADRKLRECDIVYALGSNMTNLTTLLKSQSQFIDLEQDERFQYMTYMLDHIRSRLLLGLKIVICLKGDPFFLNVGVGLTAALTEAKIPFRVVPGIIPLFNMSLSEGLPFIYPHANTANKMNAFHLIDCRAANYLQRKFGLYDGTIIFYAKVNQLSAILRRLEEENFDPDLKCAYMTMNNLGTQGKCVYGRLGSFFRKLSELNRSNEGYFVLGDGVNMASAFDMKNSYEHPLTDKNVLVPLTKTLTEHEQDWISYYEHQGANVVEYKIGQAVVTKKTREGLKKLLNQLATGTLRMASSIRVDQETLKTNRELASKDKKASPLKDFTRGNIWLVFHTSVSVDIFFKLFHEEGYDIRQLAGYLFVAANHVVFRALAKHGVQADLFPRTEGMLGLGNALLKHLSYGDYIISFNYEGKSSIFEGVLRSHKFNVINVGIYIQQFHLPNKKQLIHLIDSCDLIVFMDPLAAVGMVQAMISAGFDHDTILSRPIQLLATNAQVKELLESSGFKVSLVDKNKRT